MSDMKVFLELAAKTDKFRQGMREGEKALGDFRQYAQKVGHAVQELTSKIGILGNAATALSTGLVLKKLFSVADYMPVDDALLRMRVNFKNTAKEMDAFKKQLTALAGETGEEQGRVFQMASKLSLAYKPADIAEIIKQADRISDATKAPLESSQEGLVQIMKLYKLSAKEAQEAADAIVASRVDLESLDVVMQRLAMRSGTKKDYTEVLGFIRGMSKAGIDKPRLIAQMNEAMQMLEDKAERLQHSGIKVFSTDASGNRVWRDKIEVLKDLEKYIIKTKKTMSSEKFNKELDEAFGVPKTLPKLQFLFDHLKDFESGVKDMGNAAEIAEDRAGAGAETWVKQLDKIKAHLGGIKNDLSFIYDLAKKPVKILADSPNLTKAAGYTAAGLSAVILSALTYGNIKNALKGLGATGAGIVVGKEIQAATGVTPVFVVNMPPGGITGGGALEKTTEAGVMARVAAWLAGLVPAAAIGAAGVTGVGLAAGATAGAVLTTGTALNSGVDALRGGKGDNWINDAFERQLKAIDRLPPVQALRNLGDFIRSDNPEIKNTTILNLHIDKDGRVIADSGNKGGDLIINLNRGTPFGN